MYISVIICTYRRAQALGDLLECLAVQTYRDFEVLVVDGSGEDVAVCYKVAEFTRRVGDQLKLRLIQSPKGLTRQRNKGLELAEGEIICFLDDDVTFGDDFLATVVNLLARPELQDVGGITAYDPWYYAQDITLRWKLRWWFGIITSLEPGAIDKWGRSTSLNFVKADREFVEVGWLGGICMIYRRSAIENQRFDEALNTYAGEDIDFSARVGRKWRLVLCTNLIIRHHSAQEGRVSEAERIYQTAFGIGRSFGKQADRAVTYLVALHHLLAELTIDFLSYLANPLAWRRSQFLWQRVRGFSHGFISGKKPGNRS